MEATKCLTHPASMGRGSELSRARASGAWKTGGRTTLLEEAIAAYRRAARGERPPRGTGAQLLRVSQSTVTGNRDGWFGDVQSYGDNNIDGNFDADPAPTTIPKK